MKNYGSPKERRNHYMNSRIEATQVINPITGQPYLDDKYSKVKRLEDPLQAHLRMMEERNPSEKNHEPRFLKSFTDRLHFIDRALQYRKEFHIFKAIPTKNEKDYVRLYPLHFLSQYKMSLEEIIKNRYDTDTNIISLYNNKKFYLK